MVPRMYPVCGEIARSDVVEKIVERCENWIMQ